MEEIQDKKAYAHYHLTGYEMRASVEAWIQWLKYGDHQGEYYRLYAGHLIEERPLKEIHK